MRIELKDLVGQRVVSAERDDSLDHGAILIFGNGAKLKYAFNHFEGFDEIIQMESDGE